METLFFQLEVIPGTELSIDIDSGILNLDLTLVTIRSTPRILHISSWTAFDLVQRRWSIDLRLDESISEEPQVCTFPTAQLASSLTSPPRWEKSQG